MVYYGRYDLAASCHLDRCLDLLQASEKFSFNSINDAIEIHQCKLTVDGIPEFFEKEASFDAVQSAQQLFRRSCKFVNTILSSNSVAFVYDQVESQYLLQFWQLMDACGAEKMTSPTDIAKLLATYPACITYVLERNKFVSTFSAEIAAALRSSPRIAAELIISHLAAESRQDKKIYLPKHLKKTDIDSIILSYINSEEVNLNYLDVLCNWPSGVVSEYIPSADVFVQAKRKRDESRQELFKDGIRLKYGAEINISMSQVACKGMFRDGLVLIHSFSGRWLEQYIDPATIMNNLLYVFDYVDPNGLMLMPARKHEAHGIMEMLGMHAIGEYRSNIGSNTRDALALLEVAAYSNLLEQRGTRLEAAIEWAYNDYFADEFHIDGFSIALPTKETSWLDKCKAIGPEIERAIKAYSVFVKYGRVDPDYFPYESIKSFSTVPAVKQTKYAVEGSEFSKWSFFLFSDQCMLSYPTEEAKSGSCFFNVMIRNKITRNDYADYCQLDISQLEEMKLIVEKDGRLMPTSHAVCLKRIWDYDALPLRSLAGNDLGIAQDLVNCGILSYCDKLFTPTEADYLDYMFNDASFPNSLGLRNRYDHAHTAISDPNARETETDYYRLLCLLICITLKINEELMYATNRGGLDDLVDWPLYDESVYKLAKELADESGEDCEW